MQPHSKTHLYRGNITTREHILCHDLIAMPVTSRDMDHLPALVRANNYAFYTDSGQYDLRKMYEEWRAGLSHFKVPRLCRLDHHDATAGQQTHLPDIGRAAGGVSKVTRRRLSQHSASSPPTCRLRVQRKPALEPPLPSRTLLGDGIQISKTSFETAKDLHASRVGRFEGISKIGQGSYGTVFKCRDRDTGAVVAIKRFLETDATPNIRKIAYREIRILKQLRHPHIVTLLEVFRRKRRLHLVFEYCDRTLLDEIQRSKSGIPENIAQRMMGELLEAILVVHSHRAIHRDIKPENILLTGPKSSVKLCDFGFARSFNHINQENDQYTEYVATRWYRAPELLVSSRPSYGPGVDIWAVGCVFYECMTRHPLLPGVSDIDQLYLIEQMFGAVRLGVTGSVSNVHRHRLTSLEEESTFTTVFDISGRHFSKEAQNTILSMLQTNPSRRASACSLLQRPYFANSSGCDDGGQIARPPTTASNSTSRIDCHVKEVPAAMTELPELKPNRSPDNKTVLTTPEKGKDSLPKLENICAAESVALCESLEDTVETKPDTVREHPLRSVTKLPKVSLESLHSVKSLHLTPNNNVACSVQKPRVYALRRSMSRPNFLPTILA